MEDRIMTIVETAELLQVHPETVKEWIQEGKLGAVRIGHRTIRVMYSAVTEFLKVRERKAIYVKPVAGGQRR